MKKLLCKVALGVGILVAVGLVAQTVRDLSASEKLWQPITDQLQ